MNKNIYGNLFQIVFRRFIIVSRNIYKNTIGNKVIFEEINHDLILSLAINGIQVINMVLLKNLS